MNKCTQLVYVVLLVFALAGVATSQSKDLLDLAAAERAFAAETVKLGFRDGFIKYFADDGIGFGPHPERTREKLLKSAPPTGPRKVIFNWAPMFGDISDAGDLGYTTGPVLFTDLTGAKPPWHGIYFSVWQKQTDGTWKVAIDMGVDTPEGVAPIDTKFTAAIPVGIRRPNPMRGTPGDNYRSLDLAMSSTHAKKIGGSSFAPYLDKQFRVHRKGMMPITDGAGLRALPNLYPAKFEFIDGKVASSDDLAFTYGKYTATNGPGGDETGYYVHVWRRDADSKWRLVVDVQNPLPKAQQ